MKGMLIIGIGVVLLTSCDRSGRIFLTNGYMDTVTLIADIDYKGSYRSDSITISPGVSYSLDGLGGQGRTVVAMRIEDTNGTVLAEYSADYLEKLRNAHNIQKKDQELWHFSEKGLFLKKREIYRRFKSDREKMLDYYRSEEAVEERERLLAE